MYFESKLMVACNRVQKVQKKISQHIKKTTVVNGAPHRKKEKSADLPHDQIQHDMKKYDLYRQNKQRLQSFKVYFTS